MTGIATLLPNSMHSPLRVAVALPLAASAAAKLWSPTLATVYLVGFGFNYRLAELSVTVLSIAEGAVGLGLLLSVRLSNLLRILGAILGVAFIAASTISLLQGEAALACGCLGDVSVPSPIRLAFATALLFACLFPTSSGVHEPREGVA
jgi:hypothetical protein